MAGNHGAYGVVATLDEAKLRYGPSMPRVSAGILAFRRGGNGHVEVLLGRLGGPYFASREHWTIPKGIVEAGESPAQAAYREFEEETGWPPPAGEPLDLGEVRQSSGKRVVAWALEGDYDPETFNPGTFEMEWPPRSGRIGEFPELSEVRWWPMDEAKATVTRAQIPLLERLQSELGG